MTATATRTPKKTSKNENAEIEKENTETGNNVVNKEEVEPKNETQANTANESEDENESKVPKVQIPENEFELMMQILKSPVEGRENEYFISKEAPQLAFPGRKSPRTLLQTAKSKLFEREIIEEVEKGGPQNRAIVRLLNPNFEMSNVGRGRKVGVSDSKPTRRNRHETVHTPRKNRPVISNILSKIRDKYEDLNAFQKDLQILEEKYPYTFATMIESLRNSE